jgi:NTP pyrophosphatase (non-canonical NTP hydrolase)
MELRELQHQVDQWVNQFEEGYWHPLAQMTKLTEEVGELAREINHYYGQKPKKPEEPPGSIALEIGDILFVLGCFANSLGIDLEQAFTQVIEKYKVRDAERWTPIKKDL